VIVIGSTLASYKCGNVVMGLGPEESLWLGYAEQMVEDAATVGHEVRFFAALELDARGLAPFTGLLRRLEQIHQDTGATVETWTFGLDTGAHALGTQERLVHICTGRNLVTEHAMRVGAQ